MPIRMFLLACLLMFGTARASAQSTGNVEPSRGSKTAVVPKPRPDKDRQGGDTIATATPIAFVPFVGSGTTAGYANDYDAVCPYGGSASPDVVYSFTGPEHGALIIDFCGSQYDTKIYVMSADGQILDCDDDFYNDDTCGRRVSRIENLWLPPGETYYLVVDGKSGAAGSYTFEMRRWGNDVDPPGNGDTFADARRIESVFPVYHDFGTTEGYTDDYEAPCPDAGSTSPDVVYRYTAQSGVTSLDIDLCHSSFDTKIYVYNSSYQMIACNDDYYWGPCFPQTSRLDDVPVQVGQRYYIVIDGFAGAYGAYDLVVHGGSVPCPFACPASHVPEGEPALYDNYVDQYDGGCNTPPGHPFRDLSGLSNPGGTMTLCGSGGWYIFDGSNYRDTDWYLLPMGPGGMINVAMEAEQETYIFELWPQDCDNVAVLQSATGSDCSAGYMSIEGYAPGQMVWFWVGSTRFTSPDGAHPEQYQYACWFSGLAGPPVETERTTWSTLKSMFR